MEIKRPLNKKILKKFLNLLDKGVCPEACLEKFPDYYEELKDYAEIIVKFNDLKPEYHDADYLKQNLKDIYTRARIENLNEKNRIPKKDLLLIRFRPAFFKPLIVFFSVFAFFSLSFAGTVYASSDTVPGEALYAVKRASENIQIAFMPYGKEGGLYFKFLNRRLNEADILFKNSTEAELCHYEKLLTDIDFSYKKCIEHNYHGLNDGGKMKGRINKVIQDYGAKRPIQDEGKENQDSTNMSGHQEKNGIYNSGQQANTIQESPTPEDCTNIQESNPSGSQEQYQGGTSKGKSTGYGIQKGQS